MLEIEANAQLVIQALTSNEADLSEEGPKDLSSMKFTVFLQSIWHHYIKRAKNYKSLTDVIRLKASISHDSLN